MRSPSAAPTPFPLRRLGLFGIVFTLALMTALVRSQGPAQPERSAQKSGAALRPARNPERLHLLLERGQVFGWISGLHNHLGETVTVTCAGNSEQLPIREGNTFVWPYKVAKPTRAEFTFGELEQTITVDPPTTLPPCVFFVLDRSVYRPRQTLRFAGFLRDLNKWGQLVPRQESVEVFLTSEHKKTTIARLELTADAQGRITGEYTFTDADLLDNYRLSIRDYQGEARVRLAEYRKTKVHLNILSQREGSRLKLRFQARDYLDKPVKNARVQYIAQIVREPVRSQPAALDGKQFAYAGDNQPPVLRPEDLTIEERVLAEADTSCEALGGLNVGRERQVVTQMKGQLLLSERGEGVSFLDLHRSWLQEGHTVVVRGVLIDGNGREERHTKTISLQETGDTLQLCLPQSTFRVNELIRVKASTSPSAKLPGVGTLVAMRLSPSPPTRISMGGVVMQGIGGMSGFNPGLSGRIGGMGGMMGMQPILMSDWSSLRQDLATALIFKGDTAVLRLREPGAYVLTAIWQKRDGSRLQQKIGCTVLPDSEVPPLRLHLDGDTYESGETLTGSIHSKYADACVLVTLRDGVGVRMWQTMRLKTGKTDIKLPLPKQLHYGCSVEVQYADSDDDPPFVASRIVHVVPTARMLNIHSKLKPVIEPGSKAVVDFQVNRREPVDLIVAVYDKALLKIAPDQSTDIRNFYLADDRIYQNHAREILRRRLDDLTLREMLKQARSWLKEHADKRMTAEGTAIATLVHNADDGFLRTSDVATLLRLAGIKTRAVDAMTQWTLPASPRRRLALWKWLQTAQSNTFTSPSSWHLHFALVDDTFLLSAYSPMLNPHPWNTQAMVYYPYRPSFGGGSMLGIGGGLGGLGGIGGIAGLGGSGFNNLGMSGMMGMGGMGIGGFAGQPQLQLHKPNTPVPFNADNATFSLPIRRDFADAAYWNAKLRTGSDGKAHVEFKLPDSLTEWQVVVTAVSRNMHVGRHETAFRTARPLMVTPILPRFFTEGDKVRVSANVANGTDTRQSVRVRLKADNGKVAVPADKEIILEPHGSSVVSWSFQAGDAGEAALLISAQGKDVSDASLKKLPVVRTGAEQTVTASGFCTEPATIKLPEGVDPSQVVFEIRFAPTLTADLLDTLPFLVEYPYGCVEQTMSRFLPAIKVAQILKKLHLEDAELQRKLPGCVDAGIKRLLDLQHADGGWGWWTNDATHSFMTPYALYGLIEAEKAGYAIGRKDSIPRGLKRLEQYIEQMGAGQAADRIYCLYVYGQRHPLRDAWWDFIDAQRNNRNLSDYALALSLELAVQQKHPRLAAALAEELRRRGQKSGGEIHWRSAHFAHWADDPFEVTAAVLKALVAFDPKDELIPGILAYFAANKRGDRWNSTKDTALIVFALCDYLARQQFDPRRQPSVAFRCNDNPEQKVSFLHPTEGRKVIVPSGQVHGGVNRLTFTEAAPGILYRITLRYWAFDRNVAAENHGIAVVRRWWLLDDQGKRSRELKSGDAVPRGAYLESTVEAQSVEGDGTMQYVLVENPRPAGCEVVPPEDARFEQKGSPCLLREDRDKLIAFHHDQTHGRIIDRAVLHAELPGEYLVCPAHVEMMYKTEVRGHSGTFAFRVAEK